MAKEPLPGQVKTRLAKDLGTTVAAWWFRHQLKYILRNLSDPRWELVVSLSPDFFVKRSKFWPSKIKCIPQGKGNLGQKMQNIFNLNEYQKSSLVNNINNNIRLIKKITFSNFIKNF